MKVTIDSAGRLVIPRELRRRAGLAPGMPLEISWHDGHLEIEPAPIHVALQRQGRFLVAVPDSPLAPLTVEIVEATRQAELP